MATKAPAVQIYIDDFLNGTRFLSNAQTGLYIRLLLEQADKGFVSQEVIDNLHVYGKDAQVIWPSIACKFERGEDGKYRNARMSEVTRARDAFRLKQSEKGRLSAEARLNRGSTKKKPRFNRGSTVVQPLGDGDGDNSGKKERASNVPPPAVEPVVIALPFTSEEFTTSWAEWETSRRKRGKPISEAARKMQLAKCVEWGEERAVAALKHSITNDYQGLYEPNNRANHGPASKTIDATNAQIERVSRMLAATRQ